MIDYTSKYLIKKYQPKYFTQWNSFIENSKNGTFLFHRDFMEYHNDRFEDFSLMVYKGVQLIAVMPANKSENTFYSHQGLTYGGLILQSSIGVVKVESVFLTIIDYLKKLKFTTLKIKNSPLIYHKLPSFELEPLLHRLSATLYNREQNLAIDYRYGLKIHKTKRKHFERNHDLGFVIKKNDDFSKFWNEVLIPRLQVKHNVMPVHTIEEITTLNKKFKENIIQYEIYLKDELLAGITLFLTDTVVKSQYGAVTGKGEKYRALDYLFLYLINKFKEKGYHYFDMGTVVGNTSLLKQKEELGCSQYLQDFYELKL